MTKDSKVRTVLGVAVAAALVGTVAIGVTYADQQAPNGGGMMMRGHRMMAGGPLGAMRRGLSQLELSDQQKTQIKAIFQGHKADIQDFATKMRPARQALNNAITSGADETAIRAAAAGVAAVEADMAVFRAAVRAQVFAVLTSDQQAKAKARRQRASGF